MEYLVGRQVPFHCETLLITILQLLLSIMVIKCRQQPTASIPRGLTVTRSQQETSADGHRTSCPITVSLCATTNCQNRPGGTSDAIRKLYGTSRTFTTGPKNFQHIQTMAHQRYNIRHCLYKMDQPQICSKKQRKRPL